MKKNKLTRYIFFVTLLFVLGSCSDWLNLEPVDGVPRQNYWKTKEDVNSAVTGIYASLLNSNLVTRMFLYGEWRADMIQSSTRKNSDVQYVIDGEISAENSFCNWSSFYNTINICNTVLKYAPEAYANDESFTEKMLREYEAQAITIRSLMYFYLVRTFGDVPLTLDAYVDNSQQMSIAKTEGQVILDSLVNHLKYAEKYIPYSYGSTEKNKGKATIWMVKALLADVYLWTEKYEECNRLCDEIINSGQFALIPVGREKIVLDGGGTGTGGGEEAEDNINAIYYPNEADINKLYNELYNRGNSVESVFELQFNTDILNPFYAMMSMSRGYLTAKTDILSEEIYIPTDIDDRGYYDIRESVVSNKGYIWKYIGQERGGAERAETEMTANYIIYRLAEVYLMQAEALVQIGIAAGDDQDYYTKARASLEKVRARANAVESTDLTFGDVEYSGKTLEEFILQERAREMAYEGKRWFDALRQAKRNNYSGENLGYLTRLAVSSAPPEKVFGLQTKYKNHKSHYLPIYYTELEANPLLVQNEFYGNK
ncbi:hypothetical protein EZS27_010068 [termite gut metagenome]|uniref:RagB/SusD family nutrient uptake outer membrane protein n=1 Tax=termite gut metagenome TaxID=433724 RepID=A0A5J4S9X7_9ZZZZ